MAAAARRTGAARAHALWFRCDLRLDDHPALHAACEGAEALVPVYVFDPAKHNVPTLAGARKSGARRSRFLLESVACLRRQLESKGSGLAVALGRPEEVLPGLCGGCQRTFATQGVCTEERAEEARVAKRLPGGELKKLWGGTLYMPEECGCNPKGAPLLFTAFKNRAEGRGRICEPLEAPRRLPPLPSPEAAEAGEQLREALRFLPTLQQLGYPAEEAEAALEDDPRGVMPFEGGEVAGLQRLQSWMFDSDKLREYFEIRNGMLGEGYSSKFSPWLAHGCISPRRVWKEAQRYERERVKNKSTYWLIFELTWRDFFVYMGWGQGSKLFVPGGITGDKTPWKGTKEALECWKEGRTGDPLVDANMIELKTTGWMSNRGRQNVASYLIFDLGVDWRYGAAHFEELLLDYDPCSNWGNWVAAAGLTGQRVNRFNTKKQLNDYDPRREYVDHWLKRRSTRTVILKAAAEAGEEAGGKVGGKASGKAGGKDGGKGSGKAGGKAGGKSGRGASSAVSYYGGESAAGQQEDSSGYTKKRRWQTKSPEVRETYQGA
uniref:Cryptochrome DASH n=1 Tax=Lingulaulax polyedra TaxID=160621 RepID=A0A516AG12_LINPO|nr:cryptochrome DASH [Lingulodinium polyedra]